MKKNNHSFNVRAISRHFAIVMCLVMLVSLCPLAAFSQTEEDASGQTTAVAIDGSKDSGANGQVASNDAASPSSSLSKSYDNPSINGAAVDSSMSSAGTTSDEIEGVQAQSANSSAETQGVDQSQRSLEDKKIQAQAEDDAEGAGTSFVPKTVLVVYKEGVSADSATETLQRSDVTAGEDAAQVISHSGNEIMSVKIDDSHSVSDAVSELQQDNNVESVQPDYIYQVADTQADQTEINDPAALTEQYQLQGIGCLNAWDYARCNNKVGVAVVDTGCDVDHEDLSANIIGTYNSATQTEGASAVQDSYASSKGHGTHVAGIISARSNNGIGGSGVSYNANLVIIKAYDDTKGSFTTSSMVNAYDYLIEKKDAYNIRVVNMSLGAKGGCSVDDALLKKVNEADSDGILTVCAAGNAMTDAIPPYSEYPGDYDKCVSVINLTQNDERNSTSNYNAPGSTAKNISAPGTSIYSTTKDGSYGYDTGTSMSSPVVAGVAALVFAANENLTPAECRNILYSTATDLGDPGWDETYGYGKVNALAAVKAAIKAEGYGPDVLNCGSSGLVYSVSTKVVSDHFVDIVGRSSLNGGNADVYTGNSTPAQHFLLQFHAVAGDLGYYTVKNVFSGKVLDVTSAGIANGTNVQQWESNGTGAQQWCIAPAGTTGYYTLKNINSGKMLDVEGASVADGANLQIYTANGTNAQMFAFESCKISSIKDVAAGDRNPVAYRVCNLSDAMYNLDVAGGSFADGANVQLYGSNKTAAQQFLFYYDEATGYYSIVNAGSKKNLDAAGAGMLNGTNIWQYSPNGTWAQKWALKESSDSSRYFTIYCACNGLCVDLSCDSVQNETNIQCWEPNNTNAQKWVVVNL